MNPDDLRRLFPNASKSCISANADSASDRAGAVAKLEQDSGHGALAAKPIEAQAAGRIHIRFESVRKRLLDPDNICEKWMLDCLRFSGIVHGDEPDKITLETTQRKAAKGEAEHTIIELFR